MRKGHFCGKFLVIIRGCPIDGFFTVTCNECIYYRGKCVNYSIYFGHRGTGHYVINKED